MSLTSYNLSKTSSSIRPGDGFIPLSESLIDELDFGGSPPLLLNPDTNLALGVFSNVTISSKPYLWAKSRGVIKNSLVFVGSPPALYINSQAS